MHRHYRPGTACDPALLAKGLGVTAAESQDTSLHQPAVSERGENGMSANANLHRAKAVKNDEFYTQLTDVEEELRHILRVKSYSATAMTQHPVFFGNTFV